MAWTGVDFANSYVLTRMVAGVLTEFGSTTLALQHTFIVEKPPPGQQGRLESRVRGVLTAGPDGVTIEEDNRLLVIAPNATVHSAWSEVLVVGYDDEGTLLRVDLTGVAGPEFTEGEADPPLMAPVSLARETAGLAPSSDGPILILLTLFGAAAAGLGVAGMGGFSMAGGVMGCLLYTSPSPRDS